MRAVKHVRGLDGLRAVAVTLVFLSHRAHFGAVDVGQIGVWTFFLISGFLIVGELHRSRLAIERGASSRRYAFWLFAGKRALRILPVYYLLLAALAIAHRPSTSAASISGCAGTRYFCRTTGSASSRKAGRAARRTSGASPSSSSST